MRLNGKIALVTGGGGGFGEEIARRFAREGASVVVADMNEAEAERVAEATGDNARAVGGDVSQGGGCAGDGASAALRASAGSTSW